MSRHLLITCNARSATIQLDLLDREQGSVTPLDCFPVPGAEGPGDAAAMAMHGNHLWLAWRGPARAILCFAINREQRRLDFVGSFPVEDSLCHIAIAGDGRYLLAAGGEHGSVFRVGESGLPAALTDRVEQGPMAHCLVANGDMVIGTSLLSDRILRFRLDLQGGTLVQQDVLTLPAGSGPRHVAFSASGLAHVLLQEGGAVVTVETGPVMRVLRTLPLVAAGEAAMCGEIAMTPDGRHLLATERNSNRLFIMPVSPESGLPQPGSFVETPDYPRAFHISADGGFVVTLGFRGHMASVHAIGAGGELHPECSFATGERPGWVLSTPLE